MVGSGRFLAKTHLRYLEVCSYVRGLGKIFWLRKNGYIEWIQHVSTYRGHKYTEPPGEREQKLEVEKKQSGWIEGKMLCWCCV